MVNFLSLLAARALSQNLEKRDGTTSTFFTTAFTTHYDGEPGDVLKIITAFGYVASEIRVSNGITYTTVKSFTGSKVFPTQTSSVLTTIFTPPPFCFTEYSAYFNRPAEIVSTTPRLQLPGTDRTECFPPRQYDITYYSPGICPLGYTIDRMSYTISITIGSAITESRGVCCPSGFQYSTANDEPDNGHCESYINSSPTYHDKSGSVSTFPLIYSPTVVTVHYTTGQSTTIVSYQTNPAGTITIATISPVSTIPQSVSITVSEVATIQALPISIRWKPTDQVVLSWLGGQNATNDSNKTPLPTALHTNMSKHRVSGAVIAGIVIGSLAGLFLVAVGVLFFCRRARKHQQAAMEGDLKRNPEIGIDSDKGNGFVVYASPYDQSSIPAELESQLYPIELSADASNQRHISQSSNLSDQTIVRVSTFSGFSPSIPQLPPPQNLLGTSTATTTSNWGTDLASAPDASDTTNNASTHISPASPAISSGSSHAKHLREQQIRIREERARLSRLQALVEMDARLERELQEELERERTCGISNT